MAEIYLHIGARMADYIATHPYVSDPVMIYLPALIDLLHFRIRECLQKRSLALPIVLVMYIHVGASRSIVAEGGLGSERLRPPDWPSLMNK